MRTATRLCLVPVTALLVALAGCGSPSASVPACNLVATSEIAAAYGGTVGPGRPNITPGVADSSSCVYIVKGGNVGTDGDIEVTAFAPMSLSSFLNWASNPLLDHKTLSGLGDAAFYGEVGGVVFQKGNRPYGVAFGVLASTTRAEILKAHEDDMGLARLLASKV